MLPCRQPLRRDADRVAIENSFKPVKQAQADVSKERNPAQQTKLISQKSFVLNLFLIRLFLRQRANPLVFRTSGILNI